MTRRPVYLSVAAAVAVASVLASCSLADLTRQSGDRIAEAQAESIVAEIGDAMTPPVIHDRPADYLVATHVPMYSQEHGDGRSTLVEALSWSGSSGSEGGAQIDLRITVEVPAASSGTIGGSSNDAGSAERCFHLVVVGNRFYDNLAITDVDCPDPAVAAPPLPVPDPLPALPADARDILARVLEATTPESLHDDVADAFPEDFIVTSTEVHEGSLVAAVGVPIERECIVGIRDPDGAVSFGSFDPVWAQPGETGCAPGLVLRPPL